jgi:hypothetical protein
LPDKVSNGIAKLRSDDRVLSLSVLPVPEIAAIARILMSGCFVALGSADEVADARRALSEFDNVMFVDATPAQIPWRESFFTKILVPPHLTSLAHSFANEVHRVLAPGGEIISNAENV